VGRLDRLTGKDRAMPRHANTTFLHTLESPSSTTLPALVSPARPAGWRYSGAGRDLRLDLLRGLAALAMIIDHVGGPDSWLYAISGGDRFFVSAAEAFVFISGLVFGIVYAGLIARRGLRAALVKGARRVVTLYGLTVGLSLLMAVLAAHLGLFFAPKWTPTTVSDFVGQILTLQRTFYLTDVLLLYTLVVAVALPALVLLQRRLWWLVLGASWATWVAWQWWPSDMNWPWAITDNSLFHFAAWQVLFLTGLVIGYTRRGWERRLAALAGLGRARLLQVTGLVLAVAAVGATIGLYFWSQAPGHTAVFGVALTEAFGKGDVRAGRLALFACLFLAAYGLATLAWQPIRRLTGWLLLPLGQDALLAYTLHLFVIAGMSAWLPAAAENVPTEARDNALRQALAIALIWGLIRVKAPAGAFMTALGRGVAAGPAWARASGWLPTPRPSRLGRVRLAVAMSTLTGILLISTDPVLASALGESARVASVAIAGPPAPTPSTTPVTALDDRAIMAMVMSGTPVPTLADGSPDYAQMRLEAETVGSTTPEPAPVGPLPSYIQEHTFHSAALDRDMSYYIYLPPDYAANPTKRYPVLYMLHGMGGSNSEWLSYGLLGRANDMITVGQIAPMIIVLPQGDKSFWIDHADGGPRWGTYLVQDVVGEIDTQYRTLADRDHRAVGGLSMGGYGAMTAAILHPDVFGVVGAHSPASQTRDTAPAYFGDQAYFDAHDPPTLYPKYSEEARTLQIWVDIGQQDPWYPDIENLHVILARAGIPHQWEPAPGNHGGEYWSSQVMNYLVFYSEAMTGAPAPAGTPVVPQTPGPAATPLPTPLPAAPLLPLQRQRPGPLIPT
jgi:enterochelin esterase-like enzyme